MINNMISISLDGKPCVSEAYSILLIYNSITLILVRVERKSLIRKTLILIQVPFVTATKLQSWDILVKSRECHDRGDILRGGMVFHVLNRGVGRRLLFTKDEDFLAFERVVEETLRTRRMRLCAFCLMSNHWHFVVWPERDGDLPAFMQQVTNTHVKRWKEHRHEIGYGHL